MPFGAGDAKFKAPLTGCVDVRVTHVVAVANKRNVAPRDGSAVLHKGLHVRKQLARVEPTGHGVDDGNTCQVRKGFQFGLAEHADGDQVDHLGQHAGRVGDRFTTTQLRVVFAEEHRVTAKLKQTGFKSDAGARGLQLKNDGGGFALQGAVHFARLVHTLQLNGSIHQALKLLGGGIQQREETALSAHRSRTSWAIVSTMASASASLMVSGGSMRTIQSCVTLISTPASSACVTSSGQG